MPFAYPISLEVAGRRCLVFGSGAMARARAAALLDAGAEVTVIARPYEDGDLGGAFLAVAATGDGAETARIFAAAERDGVLLNAVDDPAHCHFAVPAVLRRDDLVVTVSTGGRAPGYAGRLRDELAHVVGPEHGALVDLIGSVRAELQAKRAEQAERAEQADRAGQADRAEQAGRAERADRADRGEPRPGRAAPGEAEDFDRWARRWRAALDHDLIGLVRAGRAGEARTLLRAALADDEPREAVA